MSIPLLILERQENLPWLFVQISDKDDKIAISNIYKYIYSIPSSGNVFRYCTWLGHACLLLSLSSSGQQQTGNLINLSRVQLRGSSIGLARRDAGFGFSSLWYSGFELKTGAGSQNFNYERERDFVFLWGRDGGFARQTEKDTGCQFFNGLVNWPAQNCNEENLSKDPSLHESLPT